MDKPVILTIDDDPQVLRAVERDLRGHFGSDYRVVAADGGASALEAARRLKLRGTPVALFLADQRMPGMTGIELLEAVADVHPDAKRVLLTAYADTEVAIAAINTIRLDHYLMKPWDPPEERLFPVLEDMLSDWQAGYRPPFEGIRVVGSGWSARGHAIKDFLARNQLPYRWLDIEADPEAVALAASAGVDALHEPLVVLADGSHLVGPSNAEIAERVGLRQRAALPYYDLVIVGRRARGACRRRLRRLGGPHDPARRARGARGPGRHHVPDRELPRVPGRPDRRGPGAQGAGAGDPTRHGGSDASDRGGHRDRRPVQGPHPWRRIPGELPGAARRDRRGVPDARPAGRGPPRRFRHLLRGRDHGGGVLPRPAGRGRRGRQLGRPGSGVPGPVRRARDAARPRRVARRRHVRVPRRPDRRDPEHLGHPAGVRHRRRGWPGTGIRSRSGTPRRGRA